MKVCPICGTTEEETHKDMFSGTELVIRDHDDWIECKKCGYMGEPKIITGDEPTHTIHIRNLSHTAYETLWNLRKFHEASSWAELIEKIVKEYAANIREYDWI